MRTGIILALSLISLSVFAQIPNGYYDSANGLSGNSLKEALYNIIKDHEEFSYTSSSTDTWDILKESDQDPNNSNNVILIYSGESVNGPQEYNNNNGWTREHVWAKSRGDFGTSRGAGTDCHHLKPCSGSMNSTRSNRAFGEGGTEVFYDGYNTGNFKGTDYTYEPRDAVKGDVARMILYMAVRYEGENGEPDLELTESVYGSTDKQPIHGIKTTILKWHKEDPVDDFERRRNNVIYSYQKNRNPFIDHPEFVSQIWETNTSISDGVRAKNPIKWTVNGNVLNLESDQLMNRIELYDMTGQRIFTTSGLGANSFSVNTSRKGIVIVLIDNVKPFKVVL